MVCALGGRCSAAGQGCGAPFVRTQEPAGGGAVVDRSPDQRVPEAEPAGHLGASDDTDGRQLIDRGEGDGLHDSRGDTGELRLERIAHHGCSLQQQMCAVAEQGQLVGKRGGHRRGYAEVRGDSAGRRRRRGLALQGSGELLEVERVAAALVVQGGRGRRVDRGSEELVRLGPGHRRQGDAGEGVGAVRAVQFCLQPGRQLPRAGRECDHHPGVGWSGEAAIRGARRRPGRPSGRRRGSAPAAWSRSAVPAAHAPHDGCGSARAGRRRPGPRGATVTGRRCRAGLGRRGRGGPGGAGRGLGRSRRGR